MEDEFRKIEWLTKRLRSNDGQVPVDVGDDAAVLRNRSALSALTVDTQVEGVHFRRGFLSWEALGARAVITAASDIVAMGASPSASLLALILPPDFDDTDFRNLVEGADAAAKSTGARIVGGNLSAGSQFSLTTTVVGASEAEPIGRAGGRPGEILYVTGEIGAAALGLALLMADETDGETATRFVERWRRPPVRSAASLRAATAAIDISDGLLQDLGHLCRASKVGARIFADRVPLARGHRDLCAELELDATRLALCGGEDYELLFSAPSDAQVHGATPIGELTEDAEVLVFDSSGQRLSLDSQGFRHFS